MRSVLFVLLITGTVLAGPGSWQAIEHGPSAEVAAEPANPEGNAKELVVVAGPLVTSIKAVADPGSKSRQDGAANDVLTTWYTLKFVGAAEAVNHTWKITTLIFGVGLGTATAKASGSATGESLQAVQFAGDHDNVAGGILGVQKEGAADLSIGFPSGISLSTNRTGLRLGVDTFKVNQPKATSGWGQCCRVRVDTYAKARVCADAGMGSASVDLFGRLRGNLLMTGHCLYRGLIVEDMLHVTVEFFHSNSSQITPPTGGVVGEGDIPTDTPTEEERNGESVDGPVVPASELEDEDSTAPEGENEDSPTVEVEDEDSTTGNDTPPAEGNADPVEEGPTTEED